MKTSLRVTAFLLPVLLLAGCASAQASRIREKPTVFQSLTPRQQKQIKAGHVRVGFTTDMVYLALGKPSSVSLATTTGISHPPGTASGVKGNSPGAGTASEPTGPVEIWTYTRYVPWPQESSFILPEDRLTGYHIPHIPSDAYVPADAYEQHFEPKLTAIPPNLYTLKLLICAGKVVAIKLVD